MKQLKLECINTIYSNVTKCRNIKCGQYFGYEFTEKRFRENKQMINTCPYCNESQTIVLEKRPKTTPHVAAPMLLIFKPSI